MSTYRRGMRTVPLVLSTLVVAAGSSAALAPTAGAAYRCGSVNLPATDGRASTKVTKGSPGCKVARSLMVATWEQTLFGRNSRSVTVRRGGRAYGCIIGQIRDRMVCTYRKDGKVRIRVRALVI